MATIIGTAIIKHGSDTKQASYEEATCIGNSASTGEEGLYLFSFLEEGVFTDTVA